MIMTSEQIEKIIESHRGHFEVEGPGLSLWQGVSAQLDDRAQKRHRLWQAIRSAAAVVALVGMGAALGIYFRPAPVVDGGIAALVDPQFAKMEADYQQRIQEKYQQLVSYEQADAVRADLERLDEAMAEIKAELEVAPPGKEEELVRSLLDTYRAKVYILERVLSRIQMTNPEPIELGTTESSNSLI